MNVLLITVISYEHHKKTIVDHYVHIHTSMRRDMSTSVIYVPFKTNYLHAQIHAEENQTKTTSNITKPKLPVSCIVYSIKMKDVDF